jgi:hypothetical protein
MLFITRKERIMATTASAAIASPAAVTRGISIKDPWAWLIVSDFIRRGQCVKPIENRTWQTGFRGPIAIATSTSKTDINPDVEADICDIHPAILRQCQLPDAGGNKIFHPGCIVGTVDVIGCIAFDPYSQDFEKLCRAAGFGAWYDRQAIPPDVWASGPFCFLLDNPKQFTQPVAAVGALNIWHIKQPVLAAVAAALAKPLGSPYEYRAKLNKAAKSAKQEVRK